MRRRTKNQKAAKGHHEDETEYEGVERGGKRKPSKFVFKSNSSDDEEANEDLSLKIIEKARLRAISNRDDNASAALDGEDVSLQNSQNPDDIKGNKKAKRSRRIRKKKKTESPVEFEVNLIKNQELESVKNVENLTKDQELESVQNVEILTKDQELEAVQNVENLTKDQELELVQNVEDLEVTKLVELSPTEISDNVVLKKLLRVPRYFDPQDGGWNTCYNCGEEGHKTVNCTSAKRRKPCFVCGSLEHNAKHCLKGQDCFICNKGGHRAKACPEKYKRKVHDSQICLKCGGPGHDMFSCKNSYSADDLKEISCYICKSFGHLCCADFVDLGPSAISCFKCGEIGHTGLECGRSYGGSNTVDVSCYKCGERGHMARECQSSSIKEPRGSRSESNTSVSCYKCDEKGHFAWECQSSSRKDYRRPCVESNTAMSCYNCGEGGHLARECQSPLVKTWKKHNEYATPAKKVRKLYGDYEGNKYMPPDFDNPRRQRKISHYDEDYSTPPISRNRGGWTPEHHHGDIPGRNRWRSTATPTTIRIPYNDSTGKSCYTPYYNNKHQYRNSNSNGYYSASRFDNSGRSSDYGRRSHGW